MKTFSLSQIFSISLIILCQYALAEAPENITKTIVINAAADNIDLFTLDFLDVAMNEIAAVYETPPNARKETGISNIIDVHTHVVPAWYQKIVPTTGGVPTPSWNLTGYLSFMESEGIGRSIFSFSTPGPNVFPGDKSRTIALARLMNEQAVAYSRAYPLNLSFYAVVPLPYLQEAITEANYALDHLGAVGIVLTSNIEGLYLGNVQLKPFFEAINRRSGKQILFVHPSSPCLKFGDKSIEANPTLYPTGEIEFYFETARTFMDLTVTQTVHNFTNIDYVIPHVGGAFPGVIDRFLKSRPTLYNSSFSVYSTRFWWDSAGPTYYHQVSGLLGYGFPKSRLLFGSDFPYAPQLTQAGSLAAVQESPLLTAAEKEALFTTNAQNLFGSKIL